MWYLWIFGDNVEDGVGHGRFIVFYLLCGIAAALGQIAMDPTSTLPTIGASGAIAGVMGAYFVLYPHSRVLTLIPLVFFWEIIELPAILLLGFWFLMQLFSAGAIAATAGTRRRRGVRRARRRLRLGRGGVFVFRKRQISAWEAPLSDDELDVRVSRGAGARAGDLDEELLELGVVLHRIAASTPSAPELLELRARARRAASASVAAGGSRADSGAR